MSRSAPSYTLPTIEIDSLLRGDKISSPRRRLLPSAVTNVSLRGEEDFFSSLSIVSNVVSGRIRLPLDDRESYMVSACTRLSNNAFSSIGVYRQVKNIESIWDLFPCNSSLYSLQLAHYRAIYYLAVVHCGAHVLMSQQFLYSRYAHTL